MVVSVSQFRESPLPRRRPQPGAASHPLVLSIASLLAATVTTIPGTVRAEGEEVLDLTVQEAVELARRRSPRLQAAQAEAARARGEATSSWRVILPGIELRELYAGSDNTFAGMALSGTIPQPTGTSGADPSAPSGDSATGGDASAGASEPEFEDAFISALVVTQPLVNVDGWYRRGQAVRAADAAERQADWAAAELEQAVVEAYWAVPLTAARIVAVRAGLEAAEQAVAQAEGMHREGLVPMLDVHRARSKAAGVRADLATARAQAVAAHEGLRALLGVERPVRIATTPEIPSLPAAPPPEQAALASAAERADVRAAEGALAAARAGARASRAGFLPRLNALGAYVRGGDDPLDDRLASWFVGVSLSWQVFSGLERLGNLRAAEATVAASAAELRHARSQAELEVRTAHADLQAARTQIPEAEGELTSAREAAALARARYREGLSTLGELLDANTAELQAALRLGDARYRAITQLARYRRAAGWRVP